MFFKKKWFLRSRSLLFSSGQTFRRHRRSTSNNVTSVKELRARLLLFPSVILAHQPMTACRAGEKGVKAKKKRDIRPPPDDLVVKQETIDAEEVVSIVTRSLRSAILTQDRCTCPMGLDNSAENLVRLLSARKQSKADASRKNRRVTISEDAIKSVFHLPISKAAAELGVGLTVSLFLLLKPRALSIPAFISRTPNTHNMPRYHTQVLKKYCRIFNIGRWPFRKLKSLDKLVSTVASIKDEHSLNARFAVAQGLEHKKLEMRLMPSIEVSSHDLVCAVSTSSEGWKAHPC